MKTQDFTISLSINNSPEEVFKTVLDVRSWWTGLYNEDIAGISDVLNGEFTFRAGEGIHYSKHKLIEAIPNKKIVWLVNDGKLSFVQTQNEWIGTKMCFEISQKDDQTQLKFTHEGLTHELECYDACSSTWTKYLQERLTEALSTSDK